MDQAIKESSKFFRCPHCGNKLFEYWGNAQEITREEAEKENGKGFKCKCKAIVYIKN